jgi:glutathione S-transferase
LQTELLQLLRRLELPLGRTPYVAGEFSLADAAFAPGVLLLERIGVVLDSSLPHVRRWVEALHSRASVRGLIES